MNEAELAKLFSRLPEVLARSAEHAVGVLTEAHVALEKVNEKIVELSNVLSAYTAEATGGTENISQRDKYNYCLNNGVEGYDPNVAQHKFMLLNNPDVLDKLYAETQQYVDKMYRTKEKD